ncbi:MAG: hypothetical protein MJ170_03600 [Alphaproteobacteria bacterium]|nr:hypothetical protein [Alphaproteobacteria bacterium]
MKRNIKTNLKLAGVCATAMMTLSGCGTKYTNVIEDISEDKILVKDVTDGKERIIEFVHNNESYNIWEKYLKDSHIGDTVVLKVVRPVYNNYNRYKCLKDGFDLYVHFDNELHWARQEQAKFDSLKCVIAHESQGKQR